MDTCRSIIVLLVDPMIELETLALDVKTYFVVSVLILHV